MSRSAQSALTPDSQSMASRTHLSGKVGGLNEASTEKTVEFYSTFVDEVVPLSGVKEAETAKLLENTFRHVNIALVNEMARVCHELDIDIWEVIRGAATKPFGFMRFTPGAGVGGHCIPIILPKLPLIRSTTTPRLSVAIC